jgi:hypothetical protein
MRASGEDLRTGPPEPALTITMDSPIFLTKTGQEPNGMKLRV